MLTISTQLAPIDSLDLFAQLLQSVSFADQLVVFDLGRRDSAFRDLLRQYHCERVAHPLPPIVEHIREAQLRHAQGDYVLVLDGDEEVTPELAREIQSLTATPPGPDDAVAYALRRRNYSLGASITHGGWGDDYVPRLFYRPRFRHWPSEIHALPSFDGRLGQTTHYLKHHKDESLAQMVDKTNRYSAVEAEQFWAGSLPQVTALTLLRKGLMEVWRRGILKQGYLDGPVGLIQSLYQGYSVFISYAKLYEKQVNGKQTSITHQSK